MTVRISTNSRPWQLAETIGDGSLKVRHTYGSKLTALRSAARRELNNTWTIRGPRINGKRELVKWCDPRELFEMIREAVK